MPVIAAGGDPSVVLYSPGTTGEYGVTALHEAPTIFQTISNTEALDEMDVNSVRALGFSGVR